MKELGLKQNYKMPQVDCSDINQVTGDACYFLQLHSSWTGVRYLDGHESIVGRVMPNVKFLG